MPIEITIGNITFPSKAAVIKHCTAILRRDELDSEIVGDDAHFVDGLLRQRPDKMRELADRTVVRFIRKKHPHNTPCFCAKLSDGSYLHFSFMKMIKAYPKPTSD